MESNRPVMLTVKGAAKYFYVPEHAVRRWVKEDRFLYVKSGNKFLINAESMANFLNGM